MFKPDRRKERLHISYMDISGIHMFSVNRSWIVLINQRCENDVHRFRNNVSHRCKVCGWDFETASSAFCSIECRYMLFLFPFLIFFFFSFTIITRQINLLVCVNILTL